MARRPRGAVLLLLLRYCTALAPPAREARIIELLGKGRVGLPQSDEVELDELVANLQGQKPTIASRGWVLVDLHYRLRVGAAARRRARPIQIQ